MADNLITQTISTTDAAVVVGCADNPLVSIEVSGTWAGTLNIETNLDPNNAIWRAAKVFTEASVTASASITANGRWIIQAAGVGQVRARLNPATSGAAVVTLRAGDNETFGLSGGGGGGGGAVTVADGADVALGSTGDTGIITNVAGTVIGFLRGNVLMWLNFLARLPAALVGGRLDVNIGASPATVPISAASLPLPSTAATDRATAAAPGSVELSDGAAFYTAAKTGQLPAALVNSRLDVNIGAAPSLISTSNSTATPLTANAVFTGAGEDVSAYSTISLAVFTDQASASSGLSLQFSEDNSNWDFAESYTQAITAAGAGNNYYTRPRAKFFRIVYTNGGTNQGVFRLQTVHHQADQNNAPSGLQTDLRFSPSVPGTVVMLYDAGVPRFGMQAAAKVLADADTGSRTAATHVQWFNGATYDRARTPAVFKTIAAVAVTAATPVTVWTPTAGKKFRLMGYSLSLSVAGSVILDDSAAEMIRTPLMAAGVGLIAPPLGNGILSAVANNPLKIDVSASGSVSGFVYGTEE